MYKHIAYGGVVAAVVALSGLGAGGAGASAAAGRAGHTVGYAAMGGTAGAVPGTQLWVQRHNGPADDFATSVAVSPDGRTVFITGSSTVAYNAATGAQLWVNRTKGGGHLAVSPRGDRVFVAGINTGATTGEDYRTVAYGAATGARLWVHRYDGGRTQDDVYSMAVSPSGGTVFVTGFSGDGEGGNDYATVAYNAATGAQRWVQRYNGPENWWDSASSVAVSPGGGTVFVTGVSYDRGYSGDYLTLAYNAATGSRRWAARYNGPGNLDDWAHSVVVSPGGGTVFVTGTSEGPLGDDYVTVAYNAATGARLWAKRYNPGRYDTVDSMAVSPTGRTVYVTGSSGTVAYNAATGAKLWAHDGGFASVAASPGGSTVYLTGGPGTVAYNAATGVQRWAAHYTGPDGYDARSLAVSPSGDTVFVTGTSLGTAVQEAITVAFSG